MNSSPADSDRTTAIPLQISAELAENIETVLRDFAEESELDMALVVDRSGALVAGITAEQVVSTETISALVAAASGAVDALAAELGESGAVESLHRGRDRSLYLREVADRFVLAGVAEAAIPSGIVREEALRVEGSLASLLREVEVPPSAARHEKRRVLQSLPRESMGAVHGNGSEDEGCVERIEDPETMPEAATAPVDLGRGAAFVPVAEPTGILARGITFEDLEQLTESNSPFLVRGEESPSPDDVVDETRETDGSEGNEGNEGNEENEMVELTGEAPEAVSMFELDENPAAEAELREDEPVERIPGTESSMETVAGEMSEPAAAGEDEAGSPACAQDSGPVLVSPIVVDSPFEIEEDGDDHEDEEEADLGIGNETAGEPAASAGDENEEVRLASQPGPSILPPSAPSSPPSPESESGTEEATPPAPASPPAPGKRKQGPRYSFDLG